MRRLVQMTCLGAALAAPAAGQELGQIDFPTSARAQAAQEAFRRGTLLLHSFEYEDAREQFVAAREAEPGFAMATWGEALTFYHPIWRREEQDQAREALLHLGPDAAARAAAAPTDAERAWLGSVEALFGEGTRTVRWTAYADALQRMHKADPDNVEVAAFYALAVLGTSFGGRDARTYMRAAAIAQPYFAAHPDHPGLLHYLIHCYDDPIHAPLGLPMARRYDQVAPAAGHALHMPSHIYVALGMWSASIAANIASFAAGDARRERKALGVEARNWHACQWQAYSHLQQGQRAAAAKLLDLVWQDHAESQSNRMRYHVVVMRAAHLVDGGYQHESAGWEVDLTGLRRSTAATDHFVRGMAALGRGDADTAAGRLADLRRLAPAAPPPTQLALGQATCCAPSGVRPETAQDGLAAMVAGAQLAGALAAARGDDVEALAQLREACRLEDTMDLDFGPPVVAKPAHEMLGEALLELEQADEAVREFEAALRRAPGRGLAQLGLARALGAAGQQAASRQAYAAMAKHWANADADHSVRAEIETAGGAGG
ncbi:MAG: hypothetical protein AAF628_01880 [Planctomycetota bacterium]